MALVAGVQGARPRSNAMQSRRVLEEMLPFVRPDLAPAALQQSSALPAAESPPVSAQHSHPLHCVIMHATYRIQSFWPQGEFEVWSSEHDHVYAAADAAQAPKAPATDPPKRPPPPPPPLKKAAKAGKPTPEPAPGMSNESVQAVPSVTAVASDVGASGIRVAPKLKLLFWIKAPLQASCLQIGCEVIDLQCFTSASSVGVFRFDRKCAPCRAGQFGQE
jgi:hypothetical protein